MFLCVMQVFPRTLLQPTYRDPENPRRRLARTEVERRDEYIKVLHQQLGEQHPLVLLVEECLDDEPSERPSAQELLQRLEGMKAQIRDPYQHLTKLDAVKMLKEKDMKNQDHPQVQVGYQPVCTVHLLFSFKGSYRPLSLLLRQLLALAVLPNPFWETACLYSMNPQDSWCHYSQQPEAREFRADTNPCNPCYPMTSRSEMSQKNQCSFSKLS